MPEVPRWEKIIAIPGMLLFGTCTVVVQKFLFEQKAVGLDKYGTEPHKFSKPWFQTNSMFIGMLLALVVYEVKRCLDKRKKHQSNELMSYEDNSQQSQPQTSNKKLYFVCAVPASCDLLATSLMNIGLLYIQASVWQMLRGSMVLFSSIFCAFILKRPHYPFMWWAVLMVTVALGIVGFSSVASTGVGKAGVSQGKVIMAILLVVGSQLIQASQIVLEDFLMHDLTASPILIVGLEGLWGTIITCCVFLPITQFTGNVSNEGNGVHEDTLDTFKMIGNSPTLAIFVIIYVFVILLYNVTGMFVTKITSAVVRTILEGLRTLCIWVVQLIIFYSIQNTKYGHEHPTLGEEWNIWSWMQLSGFLLLFTGMLVYNRIIEVPIFKYPPKENAQQPKNEVDDQPLIGNE